MQVLHYKVYLKNKYKRKISKISEIFGPPQGAVIYLSCLNIYTLNRILMLHGGFGATFAYFIY